MSLLADRVVPTFRKAVNLGPTIVNLLSLAITVFLALGLFVGVPIATLFMRSGWPKAAFWMLFIGGACLHAALLVGWPQEQSERLMMLRVFALLMFIPFTGLCFAMEDRYRNPVLAVTMAAARGTVATLLWLWISGFLVFCFS